MGKKCQILLFRTDADLHPVMPPKVRFNHIQKLSTEKKQVLNVIVREPHLHSFSNITLQCNILDYS